MNPSLRSQANKKKKPAATAMKKRANVVTKRKSTIGAKKKIKTTVSRKLRNTTGQQQQALFKSTPTKVWKCANPRLFLTPPSNAIFKTNFRPWSNISELCEVRDIIYTSIMCDQNNPARVLTITTHFPDRMERILYARDRLITWSRRLKNMNERRLVDDHLRLMGTLIEIVLHIERNGDMSTLDRLYGMAVIDFTKCLESYKSNEGFASIIRLAESMGCPAWVVGIRHQLVHSESHDPNLADLARAVVFIFRWMDLHFFAVLLQAEFPRPPGQLVGQQQELLREMSNYQGETMPNISEQDNQDNNNYLMVANWNEETLRAQIYQLIRETKNGEINNIVANKLSIYASKYPNEYMSGLGDVVMFHLGAQFSQPVITKNTVDANGRLLAGVGRALSIPLGLPNRPTERMLLTLLNLLTTRIDELGERSDLQEIESIRAGIAFMEVILQTIMDKEVKDDTDPQVPKARKSQGKKKRNSTSSSSTTVQSNGSQWKFDTFLAPVMPELETIRTHFEFDWMKLLYAFLMALPVSHLYFDPQPLSSLALRVLAHLGRLIERVVSELELTSITGFIEATFRVAAQQQQASQRDEPTEAVPESQSQRPAPSSAVGFENCLDMISSIFSVSHLPASV